MKNNARMYLRQGFVTRLGFGMLLGISLMAGAMGTALAQEKTFILNTSTAEPYTTKDRAGFQDLIVAEVFKRLGLKAQVEHYNASARALINANEGIDDGVAMRIRDVNKRFPNLVRVDEILIANDFVAYSRGMGDAVNIQSYMDLKGLSVGYINGWVIFEKNVPEGTEEHKVGTPRQLFEMLDKRRIDIALYERWQGLQTAHDTHLKVSTHEPPLAAVPMYMHVHKKHAHLAPKLANILRDMKQDGTYERIVQKTLLPLVPQQAQVK